MSIPYALVLSTEAYTLLNRSFSGIFICSEFVWFLFLCWSLRGWFGITSSCFIAGVILLSYSLSADWHWCSLVPTFASWAAIILVILWYTSTTCNSLVHLLLNFGCHVRCLLLGHESASSLLSILKFLRLEQVHEVGLATLLFTFFCCWFSSCTRISRRFCIG